MSTAEKRFITPEEYLAAERKATVKSEYVNGQVFAMAGASRKHNLIKLNTASELNRQLRDRPCETYQSDMRVKVSTTGLYTYPNVTVVCDEPQFEDAEVDTLLNPLLLIEVLSESTESYDRGTKSQHYRRLESLQEHVLIAQDQIHVELYARQPDGLWLLWETDDPKATLKLTSIGCELRVEDIYAKVKFDA